ncbi:MAG: 30S ribosomal protein S6 [Deltaproteobacteria bacterium]|nr:30S ribosomal protein S6 [Deltaproteobacteria bacterium]MCX7952049.1 30S ribosomal protein S6 [Deltaproteobacteria bacterium]
MQLVRFYEINIFLDPSLNESSYRAKIDSYIKGLSKYGPIKIVDIKTRFEPAYPIKKKQLVTWCSLLFSTVYGQAVEEIKKQFLIDENVLRFLIVKLSKKEVLKLNEKSEFEEKAISYWKETVN